MDLHKTYETLDQDRCIEIIAAYGVGPRDIRLLQTYWVHLTIVNKDGGYPPLLPFKGYRGVIRGESLPPMIFNVLVESAISHWVMVVAAMEAGTEGLGDLVKDLAAYFYVDDGLIVLTQLERTKRDFDVLTDLFKWVGLWTNTRKTLRME